MPMVVIVVDAVRVVFFNGTLKVLAASHRSRPMPTAAPSERGQVGERGRGALMSDRRADTSTSTALVTETDPDRAAKFLFCRESVSTCQSRRRVAVVGGVVEHRFHGESLPEFCRSTLSSEFSTQQSRRGRKANRQKLSPKILSLLRHLSCTKLTKKYFKASFRRFVRP